MKFLWIAFFLVVSLNQAMAQDRTAFKLTAAGIEAQAYPAGFVLGLRSDAAVTERIGLNLRIGYNFARRGDLGKHNNERGGGPGFSVGSRYYLMPGFDGFFVGARVELWVMNIDWEDILPNDDVLTGTTKITVLQPLVEGGYTFLLSNKVWAITPKVTLGYEINVKTKGDEVGQGAISLIGATLMRRF